MRAQNKTCFFNLVIALDCNIKRKAYKSISMFFIYQLHHACFQAYVSIVFVLCLLSGHVLPVYLYAVLSFYMH